MNQDHSSIITETDILDNNQMIVTGSGTLDKTLNNVLTPEAVEIKEALKPTDVVLNWDGYFWPLVKKLQYTYTFSGVGNVVEFTIPDKDAPRHKIPKEYFVRLKQIYEAAGWKKCVIDLQQSNSYFYIRLYINNS